MGGERSRVDRRCPASVAAVARRARRRPPRDRGAGDADRLAESPTTLGEPYSRHLHGPVRELRFHLRRSAWRLTYWLGPQQRVILLTVFRKTRSQETAEVNRAVLAQRICADKHEAATHVYDREG
jgi:phage-related protein